MNKSQEKEIVLRFVHAINDHGVDELFNLMSEDHVFIDASGNLFKDRKAMKDGWQEYFLLFPDYTIEIKQVVENNSNFGLFGYASGTYRTQNGDLKSNYWRIPASWKAIVENNKIKHWQVYCDYTTIKGLIDNK